MMPRQKSQKEQQIVVQKSQNLAEQTNNSLEDTPKKKRGLFGNQPNPEEGFNSNTIAFLRAIMPTEPLDHEDVDEMERRFDRYIQLCQEYDQKVSNLAAYTAIGITKQHADYWVNHCKTNPRRLDFIKKVQQICSFYRESLMLNGKVNPILGIFWQKNYDGMTDKQEVILTSNDPLGTEASDKDLKNRYIEDNFGKPIEAESKDKT